MGSEIAAAIKAEVAEEVRSLAAGGITPGLAVVLVGHVHASEIYVRSKVKTSGELGIRSEMLTPPESVTTEELLALIADLNAARRGGRHPDPTAAAETCGYAAAAGGGLAGEGRGWIPSHQRGAAAGRTAGADAMHACRDHGDPSPQRPSRYGTTCGGSGAQRHCGQAHGHDAAERFCDGDGVPSKTVDIGHYTREADILVAAIGKPGFVTAEMVKPGATLIDVGINRVTDAAEVARFFPGRCGAGSAVCESGGRRWWATFILKRLPGGSVHACARRCGRADHCHAEHNR